MKHIAKFAPIIAISWQINELEKILTGPGKLSGVLRNGPQTREAQNDVVVVVVVRHKKLGDLVARGKSAKGRTRGAFNILATQIQDAVPKNTHKQLLSTTIVVYAVRRTNRNEENCVHPVATSGPQHGGCVHNSLKRTWINWSSGTIQWYNKAATLAAKNSTPPADPKQPAALVNARTKPISRELAKLTKQLRKYSSTGGVEGVGEAGDEGAKEEEEGNLVKGPVEQWLKRMIKGSSSIPKPQITPSTSSGKKTLPSTCKKRVEKTIKNICESKRQQSIKVRGEQLPKELKKKKTKPKAREKWNNWNPYQKDVTSQN